MFSPKKSRRQEAKDRARVLKGLYFVVQWDEKDQEDGKSLYDVLPSKDIVCEDPLSIVEGQEMSAIFKKKNYPVKILGRGSYHGMEKLVEKLDSGSKMDTESVAEIEKTAESLITIGDGDASAVTNMEISSPKEEATKHPGQKVKSTKGLKKKDKSPSKPKSKAHKSTEKARSQESDRMTALILASIREGDNDTSSESTSAKPSPKPKSKARKQEQCSSKDEGDYTRSRPSLKKSPLKSKPRKRGNSPPLPSTSEDDEYTLSPQSSKKSPLKRKRKSSLILPPTSEDDEYTSSRSSSRKSPLKRKRGNSPVLPPTSEDNDYAGLLPLDASDGNALPQSKGDASKTSISHSITDPVQDDFGSGSDFPFPHFHSHETPTRWKENRLFSSQSPFLSDFSSFNYNSASTNPSPNPSPVVTQSPMAVLSGASHSPFFPPVSPPFMMPHSQSWPPSNQNISVQMAEMKQLLVSSLSAMQSEIHTLKTNALKPKKRKRSREQSSAGQSDSEHSEISIRSPPPAVPGVLLGDPHGENKFVAHSSVKQRDITAIEAVCRDGKKFVLAALDIFFTRSTLARSLVTRKEGRDQLDPDIIEGLRLHTNYRYPTEEPIERWKNIQRSVNDKCRNTKNRSKE